MRKKPGVLGAQVYFIFLFFYAFVVVRLLWLSGREISWFTSFIRTEISHISPDSLNIHGAQRMNSDDVSLHLT